MPATAIVTLAFLLVGACAASAPAPTTPQGSCLAGVCQACEQQCRGDSLCENGCYAQSSSCCMSRGQRAVAFTCECY